MKNEQEIRDGLRNILIQIFEEEFDAVLNEFRDGDSELSVRRRELFFMALAGKSNPCSGATQERG